MNYNFSFKNVMEDRVENFRLYFFCSIPLSLDFRVLVFVLKIAQYDGNINHYTIKLVWKFQTR